MRPKQSALDPHCDMRPVGDSVEMVVYGMDTTQNVDLSMMIQHGQAVMRRWKSALVVIDFGSLKTVQNKHYERQ